MEFNLRVSVQDLNIISGALGMRPYVEVSGVIARLQAQVTAQEMARLNPKPEPDKAE